MGSLHDLHAPADNYHGITLNHIVAVYKLDDGRPYFSIEISHLDEETNTSSALTLQLSDPRESAEWLTTIRAATASARLTEPLPFAQNVVEYVARALEQERDYDPNQFRMFKVVQRATKSAGRSSSDDLAKLTSILCYLVIGAYKVHLIPLPKSTKTGSSTSLTEMTGASHGITTLTSMSVQRFDDAFQLTFRIPLRQQSVLYLASSCVTDIALCLRQAAEYLRPEWLEQPFTWNVPQSLDDEFFPVETEGDEHRCFDRTLTAYCAGYDVNTSNIRYTINYACENAPGFELMPPADSRRSNYTLLELLAVMRALRYNESFHSISFRNINLDPLHGVRDQYGSDHVPWTTRSGDPLNIPEQERSWFIVQEIQALALKSKRLRRLDFSRCLTRKPNDCNDLRDPGCGVCEALFPLCAKQLTNVDWIILDGITLADTDVDYLYAAAVERLCHFRALDLGGCGLTDRSMHTVLQAMLHQGSTMESINISGNLARIDPENLQGQIGRFNYIRKVNLSDLQRTSGPGPLISADTLLAWKLEDLEFSHTTLNGQSVDAISTYLASSQSDTLRELHLKQCQLSGKDVAVLLRALSRGTDQPRELHLYLCENRLEQEHEMLVEAIGRSITPVHMTLQMVEYKNEKHFQNFIEALTKNTGLRTLDISKASLPYDASEDTCDELKRMFAENNTLEELNISGELAHLDVATFGIGLNHALTGLKHNKSLKILRIEHQRLGLQGASTLASVLEENRTLREVYCENNEINLQAFTVLVNSLEHNTSILYMPAMDSDRAWSLKKVDREIEDLRGPSSSSLPSSAKGTVRKTLSAAAMVGQRSFSSRATDKQPPSPGYTDKEVRAAVGSLTQRWDREVARLQTYLARNHNIANGLPFSGLYTRSEGDDVGRPGTADTLATALQSTSLEATPTAEKDVQLGKKMGGVRVREEWEGEVFSEKMMELEAEDEIEGALMMGQSIQSH